MKKTKVKTLEKKIRQLQKLEKTLFNKAHKAKEQRHKTEEALFTLNTGLKVGAKFNYKGKTYEITGRATWYSGGYQVRDCASPIWKNGRIASALEEYLMGDSKSPFKAEQ